MSQTKIGGFEKWLKSSLIWLLKNWLTQAKLLKLAKDNLFIILKIISAGISFIKLLVVSVFSLQKTHRYVLHTRLNKCNS